MLHEHYLLFAIPTTEIKSIIIVCPYIFILASVNTIMDKQKFLHVLLAPNTLRSFIGNSWTNLESNKNNIISNNCIMYNIWSPQHKVIKRLPNIVPCFSTNITSKYSLDWHLLLIIWKNVIYWYCEFQLVLKDYRYFFLLWQKQTRMWSYVYTSFWI